MVPREPGNLSALLELQNVTRRFPGVIALKNMDFALQPGEVHVLFGENGAGKSTLVNVIAGTYRPDEGSIRLRGEYVRFESPADARSAGINAVFQEFSLVPTLTVAQNMFLGREIRCGRRLDNPEMDRRAVLFASLYNNRVYILDCSCHKDAFEKWKGPFLSIAKSIDFKKANHELLTGHYRNFMNEGPLIMQGPESNYTTSY